MIILQYRLQYNLEERVKLLCVPLIEVGLAVLLVLCEMPLILNYPDCQKSSLVKTAYTVEESTLQHNNLDLVFLLPHLLCLVLPCIGICVTYAYHFL